MRARRPSSRRAGWRCTSSGSPRLNPRRARSEKGPRVGAPEAAIQGFLKSAGLARIEDATIEKDPKKGEFYVAVIEKPGRSTSEALAEIVPAIVRAFPWPKSMHWGDYRPLSVWLD